ncbi:phosphonate C-P lyase system protein PhnH [Paracoccus aminophilus]|uniref:Carbon-phosphorus lyase n=1 Tax=Paracoccus aminophilus JCM 7686 TaxID=1367847 RepID=S5Y266_PARAH|nr:phosphonate C-P lyase system protein PhnH [Paracoccus aminophilus]AGT09840.1 carbon-phosphorus lyase [Paracoccus aminophilus JCM 7686]
MTLHSSALSGGFADPAPQSARAFREVLQALSRPGQARDIEGAEPPAPLSIAGGTVALVLFDRTTPVLLAGAHDCPALRDWLTFHTGATLTANPAEAAFALGDWESLAPLYAAFPIGTAEYPDRSTTLIVDGVTLGEPVTISGPGLAAPRDFALPEPALFAENARRFPLGLDCFFTQGAQVTGLPRSTTIEVR